jgi:hypothetical protein
LKNKDQYDISGAYATAMYLFKMPLGTPMVVGSCIATADELASVLDDDSIQHAVFTIDFKLPESSNEWQRLLVLHDFQNSVNFSDVETDGNQWFELTKIQTLADIHPNVEVKITVGYVWVYDNDITTPMCN